MARSATTAGQPAEPDSGPGPDWQPTTLPDLIAWLMERDGYRKLQPLVKAKNSRIAYSTIWSWYTSSRNVRRAPTRRMLRMFAEDFDIPPDIAFRAAGLSVEEPELTDEELVVLNLYKDLDPADKEVAEQLMRSLSERAAQHTRGGDQRTTRS